MDDNDDWLAIPAFLKRALNPLPPSPGGPRKDVSMIAREDDAMVDETEADTPAPAPTKVTRKPKAAPAPAKPAKAKPTGKAAKAAAKPAKAKAAKPVKRTPVDADEFGYRKGSMKSRAAAMYAAKRGATLAEVKEKLGSVQLNVLTELEAKGFKVTKSKEAGDGARQVTRYRLQA